MTLLVTGDCPQCGVKIRSTPLHVLEEVPTDNGGIEVVTCCHCGQQHTVTPGPIRRDTARNPAGLVDSE